MEVLEGVVLPGGRDVLDDASSHMHAEQTELLAKVNRLTIPVRVFSMGSGVFLIALAGMWFYEKLNGIQ